MKWKAFDLKYDNREMWAFEQMSYLLFCAELNNRIGLFRYKNQTGIETEPTEKEGKFYGFQAKYYTTVISKNKADIIDSIEKAKSKNSQLDELFFYVNQELSESSSKSKKKPQYQIDIEEAAEKVGVNIEWRVPSHFELQLTLPENKYLYDIFFNLEPNEGDLLDEVSKHNENILQAIQTEIPFGDKKIKIDRSKIIEGLTNASQEKKNIIISGEGGCGKTSILKEFYSLHFKKIPICIFKATELNVNHINEIFQFDNKFTFTQFLDAYKDEHIKIFVVDSAEKLAEINNRDILNTLINRLKENDWNVIFTTRYAYLNDLIFHIKENYQLSFNVTDVSLVSQDELVSISKEFEFLLPENQKFIERLRNLFYLNEYTKQYDKIDKQGSFKGFTELLWKKRIQYNIIQKDNLHLQRDKCIINIAKQRYQTGRFYVNGDDLPQSALLQLKQDEILGYDSDHNGYFITHDIYEEWALDKIVSRCFSNHLNIKQFFDELGITLPIRRAFRLWLSDQLSDNDKETETFIQEAFTNKEISQFWRDEILVSVLLSDYSKTFFEFFEQDIIANDFKVLKRILFLLRIACTDVSAFQNIEIIKPKGKGWEEGIALIYKHKSDFFDNNLKLVLPVLSDWCELNKEGGVTRYSGLLALSLIQKKTETEENILKVIFNAANELIDELQYIFDKEIANKWGDNRSPYQGLCSKILEKPYIATELIKTLPLQVIQLCDFFWQKQPNNHDRYGYHRDSMESHYGLTDKHKFNYFPSSANQTPVKTLLKIAFHEALNFIIDFTNRAVESYAQSEYGKKDVVKITLQINEKETTQYLSDAIWSMYRGNGSPVVPNILQSIHMALEETLLETAKELKSDIVKEILLLILIKSKSASLTSVVCSIVLAHPDKFYEIAIILFNTIELYHVDTVRANNESQLKRLYSIGAGMGKRSDILYANERIKTLEDKHRKSNLELLFLNYQFIGVKGLKKDKNTEFIGELYRIIDRHKSNDSTSKAFGILLARMDRRNILPKISEQTNNGFIVEFTPRELSEDLKKQSEQAILQIEETFKYSSLRIWSDFLMSHKTDNKSQKHKEYDKNPLLALSETRILVKELKSGRNSMGIMDYSIPALSCSKLMIEHREVLSKKDKEYCKQIILSTVSRLFTDEYDYQIGDGVEASIHAIPSLINEYIEDAEEYISIMNFTLFDGKRHGQYKRVCDYAIESIHKSKLWVQNYNVAQSIMYGYIKLKPSYKRIVAKKRKEEGHWGGISKSSILEELNKTNGNLTFLDIPFDICDIDLLDIHDLEIIYQLIPSDTKNKVHLEIIQKSTTSLAPDLLCNPSKYNRPQEYDENSFNVRSKILEAISNFLVNRKLNEIDIFLNPMLNCLKSTEESSSFIDYLIFAEDYFNTYEQFWYIWTKLYPKMIELNESYNQHSVTLLDKYLLAWKWWNDDIKEWRSLKKTNLSMYSKISNDLGDNPLVLYSISNVLNSIGTNFKEEGIKWLHVIISNNKFLSLYDLESNTLYYLEKFLRKYIFINKQRIKEEIRLKNKIIPILDFMIERGSIHGYLLRESIL